MRLGSMSLEHAVQRAAMITHADMMVRLTAQARRGGTGNSKPSSRPRSAGNRRRIMVKANPLASRNGFLHHGRGRSYLGKPGRGAVARRGQIAPLAAHRPCATGLTVVSAIRVAADDLPKIIGLVRSDGLARCVGLLNGGRLMRPRDSAYDGSRHHESCNPLAHRVVSSHVVGERLFNVISALLVEARTHSSSMPCSTGLHIDRCHRDS